MKLKVIEHQDGRLSFASKDINIVVNKTPPKSVTVLDVSESQAEEVFKNSRDFKLKDDKGKKVLEKVKP
jgi:hypothetical protein